MAKDISLKDELKELTQNMEQTAEDLKKELTEAVAEDIPEVYIPKADAKVVEPTDKYFSHLPFSERIQLQDVVEHEFPAMMAERLGQIYAFSLNHVVFTIRFDGGVTRLPVEVYDFFQNDKFPAIMKSAINVNKVDNM